jgi:hypothetical protein
VVNEMDYKMGLMTQGKAHTLSIIVHPGAGACSISASHS